MTVAFRNRRNCVRDWLESLKWDQVPRIEHFFENHFGADPRAASANFWISLVARVCRPGCQVDNMVVLEGPQGIRKSSALRVIGGEWFTEQHESATGKGFFEVLQGKLLVEVSEMDSFSRAEVTKVKQIITCTNDRFRESYGRHAKDHPRQCIFVGTTNRDDWNTDVTGARRFWPIACQGEINALLRLCIASKAAPRGGRCRGRRPEPSRPSVTYRRRGRNLFNVTSNVKVLATATTGCPGESH